MTRDVNFFISMEKECHSIHILVLAQYSVSDNVNKDCLVEEHQYCLIWALMNNVIGVPWKSKVSLNSSLIVRQMECNTYYILND